MFCITTQSRLVNGMDRIQKLNIRSAKLRNCIQAIVLLLASIGFLIQVVQITSEYFKYATRTQITIVLSPDEAPHHNVALCFKNYDIIGRKDNFTIKQIFEMTPNYTDIFNSCGMRRPDADWISKNDTLCNELFHVSKFVMLDYICYRFSPHNHSDIPVRDVVLALTNPFAMYNVLLNDKFSKVNCVNSIVFKGKLPYSSRLFSSVTWTLTMNGDERKVDYLSLDPVDYGINRLEPPFDTKCRQSEMSRSRCS